MYLHGRTAERTRQPALFSGRAIQSMDFVHCPAAKMVPFRFLATSKLFAPAADRALGVQVVIAAVELMQFELEPPVVVRASDHAVPAELLHDLMRWVC
jgi:hypothetical protein